MPVGQLDVNTTGLMIFTNDSRILDAICKPNKCTKVYRAGFDVPECSDALSVGSRETLEKLFETVGIPFEVEVQGMNDKVPEGCRRKKRFNVDVAISTGQYHVVKKNFQAVKISLKTLERRSVGGVELGDWERGKFRKLGREEVEKFCEELGVKVGEKEGREKEEEEEEEKGELPPNKRLKT